MLLKYTNWLKKTNTLGIPHKGIVMDNIDPRFIGRLKIKILGRFEDEDTTKLPWVYPRNKTGLGGKNDSSGFVVPEIESELIVEFPTNDIYFPVYTGYWQSILTHQTDKDEEVDKFNIDEDYPESYGHRDSTNTYWKINKTKKYLEVKHTSGTKIMINTEGDLMIDVKGDYHMNVAGEIHMTSQKGRFEQSSVIHHNTAGLSNPIYDKKA